MARDLPAAFDALLTAPVTKPGYLVQIDFLPPLYMSTRGIFDWGGRTWVASGIVYSKDQLSIPGGDLNMTRLCLQQGVTDRRVQVWAFYGDVATNDTVDLQFDGFIDGATSLFNPITLPLYSDSAAGLYGPRVMIRAETGFNVLPPPGFTMQWNGGTIKFPPKREA